MAKYFRRLFFGVAVVSFFAIVTPDGFAADKEVTATKHAGDGHVNSTDHAPTEKSPWPISLAILLVVVAVVGAAPAYHRLNVGDEASGSDGADEAADAEASHAE